MEKLKQENLKRAELSDHADPIIELQNIQKAWEDSPFKDPEFLDSIKETADWFEKGYEFSEEELKNTADITTKALTNIQIIDTAVSQYYSDKHKEQALEIITNLLRVVRDRIPSEDILILNKIIKSWSSHLIFALEQNLPSSKYAKVLLLDLTKNDMLESDEALTIFQKRIDQIKNNEDIDPTDIKMLDWLYSHSPNNKSQYAKLLKKLLNLYNENYILVSACLYSENFRNIGIEQVSKKIEKYGFSEQESKTVIEKWIYGGGSEKTLPEAILKNVTVIDHIEKERPGILKFLISKFDLYDFGRYPPDLLINQFDEYENQELPYGLVIFAEEDNNGVYFEYQDQLQKLAEDLKGKYVLRFAETGSRDDLTRLLVRLRLKYGKNHKISFGILGAHGNRFSVTLRRPRDSDDHYDEIFKEDVDKYSGRKYDLFEENATLILLSCESGMKGAIGGDISKAVRVKTIAPKESSGLESIKTILDQNDQPGFKVKYSHHVKTATFKPRPDRKTTSVD